MAELQSSTASNQLGSSTSASTETSSSTEKPPLKRMRMWNPPPESDSDSSDDDDDDEEEEEEAKEEGAEDCPICLLPMGKKARCELDCKHGFHFQCIDRWFEECASRAREDQLQQGQEAQDGQEQSEHGQEAEEREEGEVVEASSLLDTLTCPCCRARRGDGSGFTGNLWFHGESTITEGAGLAHWTVLEV